MRTVLTAEQVCVIRGLIADVVLHTRGVFQRDTIDVIKTSY